MAPTIPTIEPTSFTVGDTVAWTKTLADFPASAGWELTYSFVNASNQFTESSTTADGDDHAIVITAADSANLTAGDYEWQAYATKTTERYPAGSGSVTVEPNFATGAVDGRSHVKIVLDAIEAVLEGVATTSQASSSLNGRSITKYSTEELIAFRSKYKSEYASEVKAANIAAGLGHKGKVKIRFLD